MSPDFGRTLAVLRKEKGVSQQVVSSELGISQALLSHYENCAREPGLDFVIRACEYYDVSADFLLGRTLSRDGTTIVDVDQLYDYSTEKDKNLLRGSVIATLNKKLMMNSLGILFDLLGKIGDKDVIRYASEYLSNAIYTLYRHLHRADGTQNKNVFAVPDRHFIAGATKTDLICSELDYIDALTIHCNGKGTIPSMQDDHLSVLYASTYQSLLKVVHDTDERIIYRIRPQGETTVRTLKGKRKEKARGWTVL